MLSLGIPPIRSNQLSHTLESLNVRLKNDTWMGVSSQYGDFSSFNELFPSLNHLRAHFEDGSSAEEHEKWMQSLLHSLRSVNFRHLSIALPSAISEVSLQCIDSSWVNTIR